MRHAARDLVAGVVGDSRETEAEAIAAWARVAMAEPDDFIDPGLPLSLTDAVRTIPAPPALPLQAPREARPPSDGEAAERLRGVLDSARGDADTISLRSQTTAGASNAEEEDPSEVGRSTF